MSTSRDLTKQVWRNLAATA